MGSEHAINTPAWQGHQPGGGNSGGQRLNGRGGSGQPQALSGQGGSDPAWHSHQSWWGDRDRDGDRDRHGRGFFRDNDDNFIFLGFGGGFWWPWYDYYYPYWASYYPYDYYPYSYYPYQPYDYYPYEPYTYSGGYGSGSYAAGSQDPLATGSQYFAQGDYQLARDTFLKAIVAQPDNAKARFAYGQALFALGQYQSAAEAIRQGLALDLTWPQALMDLRSAYGDPSEFVRELGQLEGYLAAHPEDTNARFLLAYNLYFSGQKDQAREEFSRLAQANPLDKAPELFLNNLSGTSGPATTPGPVTPSTPGPQVGTPAY
jgi:tetratricopeptide (TPR) repeat protein